MDEIDRVVTWAGWKLDRQQRQALDRLAQWLTDEAIPAGGLGPNEGERVRDRHIADSLVFAAGWKAATPPASMADLGSGVGLPGLPLAVLWPQTRALLVDRSGRRVGLVRRAIRHLRLANVEAVQGDASKPGASHVELVVARAAGPPGEVFRWSRGWLASGGTTVVGGSWHEKPASVRGEDILEVPGTVLDHPVWLRIMASP